MVKTLYQFPTGKVVVLPAILSVEGFESHIHAYSARMEVTLRMIGAEKPVEVTALHLSFPGTEPVQSAKTKKATEKWEAAMEVEKKKFLAALEESSR